jgi:hypothetical protein
MIRRWSYCVSTNSNYLRRFLLFRGYYPCSWYLGVHLACNFLAGETLWNSRAIILVNTPWSSSHEDDLTRAHLTGSSSQLNSQAGSIESSGDPSANWFCVHIEENCYMWILSGFSCPWIMPGEARGGGDSKTGGPSSLSSSCRPPRCQQALPFWNTLFPEPPSIHFGCFYRVWE